MKPASAFNACVECQRLEENRQSLTGRLVATTQAMVLLAGRNKPLAFTSLKTECASLHNDLDNLKLRIDAHRKKPH